MSLVQEKRHNLSDPIATCGDRVYVIGSQNGLFPDSWGGHVPHEMNGVWAHPIKLLDGYWFGVIAPDSQTVHWLTEASACRAYPTYSEFDYRLGPLRITRRDFVPDGIEGLIVTLTVATDMAKPESISVVAHFQSDLRPVWLGERTNMHNGPDEAILGMSMSRSRMCNITFRDMLNKWYCVVASNKRPDSISRNHAMSFTGPATTDGNGAQAQMHFKQCEFEAGRMVLTFFIAGSMESPKAAVQTTKRLYTKHAALFAAKQAAYQQLIDTSQIITPDAQLNLAIAWSKIATQWLVRSVPGIGTGVGAGLPEYPWWFGIDTHYAVLPMLQSGQFELVRETLLLLQRASLRQNPDGPGRVIHEISSNGAVFNEGNAVEAATHVRAVHQYWQWSGDDALLRELYPFCKQAILDYLLGRCDADGDLCPSGRSIIETLDMHSGVECIDVAAYTCEALTRLADMADFLGDTAVITQCREQAAALAKRIQTEWWLPDEGLFADVRASKREIRERLAELEDAAVKLNRDPGSDDFRRQVIQSQALFAANNIRHLAAPDDIDLPWLLRHWVTMCPAEVGIALPDQAQRLLDRLQTPEFCGSWGMYLHPERPDSMSINTGLLALTLARNGRTEDAYRWVRTLAAQLSYRTPGAICEGLPDQWCFVQLWSNLGVTSPTVESFLGIVPDIGRKRLFVRPNLPQDWQEAQVRQLRVGSQLIDIHIRRTDETAHNRYAITVTGQGDFEVVL